MKESETGSIDLQEFKTRLLRYQKEVVETALVDRSLFQLDITGSLENQRTDIANLLSVEGSFLGQILSCPEARELNQLLFKMLARRVRNPVPVVLSQRGVSKELEKISKLLTSCRNTVEGILPMKLEKVKLFKNELRDFESLLKDEETFCDKNNNTYFRLALLDLRRIVRRVAKRNDTALAKALSNDKGHMILEQVRGISGKVRNGHRIPNVISLNALYGLRDDFDDLSEAILNNAEEILTNSQMISQMRQQAEESAAVAKECAAAAKKATGGAGTGAGDLYFENASKGDRRWAIVWLAFMILLIGLTITVLICFYCEKLSESVETRVLLSTFACRAVFVAFLVTLTFWFGRMYKAMINSAMQNRHRNLCLKTYEALANAAQGPEKKDMILHEATKIIFKPYATGLIGEKVAEGGDSNIINLCGEIMKGVASKGS